MNFLAPARIVVRAWGGYWRIYALITIAGAITITSICPPIERGGYLQT